MTFQQVIFSVGDFHQSALDRHNRFRVVLCDDSGEVFSQEFSAEQMAYFSVDADNSKEFYRVEVYDALTNQLIGLGNPVWNAAK